MNKKTLLNYLRRGLTPLCVKYDAETRSFCFFSYTLPNGYEKCNTAAYRTRVAAENAARAYMLQTSAKHILL